MDPIIGEIRSFGFGFVPQGWLLCNGQQVTIQQYTALFGTIGFTYGGDRQTHFNVPNLMGLLPVCSGTSALTGSVYNYGNTAGQTDVVLLTSQMPIHTHTFNGATAPSPVTTLQNAPQQAGQSYLSNPFAKANPAATSGVSGRGFGTTAPNVTLNYGSITPVGQGQSHTNMMPYTTTLYCIAWDGYFLPRP
jgi:microcystin-dependent protein